MISTKIYTYIYVYIEKARKKTRPNVCKPCSLGGGQSLIFSTDAAGFLHAQLGQAGTQTSSCRRGLNPGLPEHFLWPSSTKHGWLLTICASRAFSRIQEIGGTLQCQPLSAGLGARPQSMCKTNRRVTQWPEARWFIFVCYIPGLGPAKPEPNRYTIHLKWVLLFCLA